MFLYVCYFLSAQIKVSNSALVSAFMKELEPESPVSQVAIFSANALVVNLLSSSF